MTWIADDQRVGGVFAATAETEAPLGTGEPQHLSGSDGPVVTALPHRAMLFDDVDARPAERGDDLGVPRIRPVIRSEVENAHYGACPDRPTGLCSS